MNEKGQPWVIDESGVHLSSSEVHYKKELKCLYPWEWAYGLSSVIFKDYNSAFGASWILIL